MLSRGVMVIAVVALPMVAAAENLNIDLNTTRGVPSDVFGGAAGQPGHWNGFNGFTVFDPAMTLNDLNGQMIDVTASFPLSLASFSGVAPGGILPVEQSALLDDHLVMNGVTERLRIDGLSPGVYDVYVYGSSLELPTEFIVQTTEAIEYGSVTGGWNGDFESGVNYVKRTVSAETGTIEIDWLNGEARSNGALAGVQIVESTGTAPADLDRNGTVDGSDLLMLLNDWGAKSPADLDNSGTVDGIDLLLLLNAWG